MNSKRRHIAPEAWQTRLTGAIIKHYRHFCRLLGT